MSRSSIIGVGALAVLVAIGVSALTLTSDHATDLVATTVIAVPIGLAFIGSGLIARVRRPDNRTGTLLMLVGFSWFLAGIAGANNPYLFTLGVASSALALGFVAHLVLAFPTGYLTSRRQRGLAAVAYVLAIVANPVTLLFADVQRTCPECPRDVLLVHRDQGVANAINLATAVLAVAAIAGIGAVLYQRWHSASIAYRRAVAPVLISSGVMLAALVASLIYGAAHPESDRNVFSWLLMVALLAVPLAFLFGLMRSRLAGAAVGRLLADTPETPTPEQAQEGLRRALGDPTLELGFWWPEQEIYVGAAGEEIESDDTDARVVTYLTDGVGLPLAAVAHDAALLEERDLLEGALAAARLAIQKDRLAAEARARLAELERERNFVRTVVNSAPAFFCVLDVDNRIERFNETLEGATGIADDDEVRGRPFWEVFPAASDRDGVRAAIEARATDQQEHLWTAADGSERVVIWRLTPLPGDRFLVSGGDITDRKRAEDQMMQHVALLSAVGDATPSLLVIIEEGGRLSEDPANETLRALTGFAVEDLARKTFWEILVAPGAAAEAERIVTSVLEGGSCGLTESRWVKKNGDQFLCEWTCTPLPTVGDRRQLALIAGVDITERKRQESELRESRARIVAAADEERRRLERNLHDGAQQRLVSLSLSLRLAQAKLRSDPAEASEVLSGASVELAFALEELRELARGLHPAVLSDRGLAAALQGLADRAPVPVELDVQITDRLSEQVEVALFYVAAEALTNVAKYAEATAVHLRLLRTNGEAIVEIADDGVGGARLQHGSGLRGLRDRVESLDGALQVTSEPGQGTIVRVVIPCSTRVPA